MRLFRKTLPGSEAITSFLMAPLVLPAVVIGVALLQYFSLTGLRGSLFGLLMAHVVITVPYIVRSALASLSGLDLAVEEAARVLGATGFEAFRLVTLPLIRPGLVAGALFAFITSLDNVPVTIFLIGANQTTLPVLIFTSVEMGVDPSVAAVSTLLIVATGIVLLHRRAPRRLPPLRLKRVSSSHAADQQGFPALPHLRSRCRDDVDRPRSGLCQAPDPDVARAPMAGRSGPVACSICSIATASRRPSSSPA